MHDIRILLTFNLKQCQPEMTSNVMERGVLYEYAHVHVVIIRKLIIITIQTLINLAIIENDIFR